MSETNNMTTWLLFLEAHRWSEISEKMALGKIFTSMLLVYLSCHKFANAACDETSCDNSTKSWSALKSLLEMDGTKRPCLLALYNLPLDDIYVSLQTYE